MIRSIPSPPAVGGLAFVLLVSAATSTAQEPATDPPPQRQEHGHGHDHQAHAHGHGNSGASCHSATHDFSNAEEWSARFDRAERQAWQKPEEVAALLEITPGMTVVDLGAGTGYFLSYLSSATGVDGRVLALDPEADMVRFMRERAAREGLGNVEPRRIPFDDPQLEAASVDRVLIVNTWHHIAEREAYSRKLAAALKPGGRVYVVDYTRDSPSGPPVAERLEPAQVIAELGGGGFEAEAIAETLPRQYVVVGRRAE